MLQGLRIWVLTNQSFNLRPYSETTSSIFNQFTRKTLFALDRLYGGWFNRDIVPP
jgi:hypothetical protein